MRVLVCGSRGYQNQKHVFDVLDKLDEADPITLIIEGGAEGADRQGRFWALAQGCACMTLHAAWESNGRGAGPIRNEQLIKYGLPDVVVAFPGGRGTDNMKQIALRHNIKVISVE